MKKGKSLTATSLRFILTISLFVISVLAYVGFSMIVDGLESTASDTSKTIADANNSRSNVQNLQRMQTELEKNKDAVSRASNIVAASKSYQYQDQIIKDLTDYANRAGISITNFDFSATKSTSTSTPGAAPQATTPAPTGVNSTSVSVTTQNPINYDSLLRFIYSIEQNLTKMQISSVGLSKEASGGVASDALTIEVYVR